MTTHILVIMQTKFQVNHSVRKETKEKADINIIVRRNYQVAI